MFMGRELVRSSCGEKPVTYGEFMRRQRQAEQENWRQLSPEEEELRWLDRQLYLWSHHVHLLDTGGVINVPFCVSCGAVRPMVHCWPSHHHCECRAHFVLDCWLPDGIERLTTRRPEELEKYRGLYAKFIGI